MFEERYRLRLDLQRKSGLFRDPPLIQRREGKYVYHNGRKLINFASNDYLGLSGSQRLRESVAAHFARFGPSSSSSRLVSGNFERLNAVEQAFADYFGYEAALFYPSGYQANLGVLSTLFEPGDPVCFDKHIHASSVKGLALSGVASVGYNHNSLSHLQKRLNRFSGPAAVVTESLFSMDGDLLDVDGLLTLKERLGLFCVVDEAHAFGAMGPGGRGMAGTVADVAVGTFGKALGLFGAFALMSNRVKSYLLNFSSPQIYTTTLPEAHAAAALDVLGHIAHADDRRRRLAQCSRLLRERLQAEGYAVSGDAHIVAVEIGSEKAAAAAAAVLFQNGVFVLPARYPTVPLNKAILRISLTADHDAADIDRLVRILEKIPS